MLATRSLKCSAFTFPVARFQIQDKESGRGTQRLA